MPELFTTPQKNPQPPLPETAPHPHTRLEAKNLSRGKVHLFTTYCTYPEGVRFENQEKDEIIVLLVRKHFITNLSWIVLTILLALLPPLVLFFASQTELFLEISTSYLLVLLLFFYFVLFGIAGVNFITWFYHVGIVTQKRVVDIDITYVTNKNVATTEVRDIVDVEYSQRGFLHSFFNFGHVHMQTEGIKANFEFTSIPNPALVADIINDLKESIKHHG